MCALSCITLRARPEQSAQVVTQLLFGDCFEIIKYKNKKWILVKNEWDACEGWLDPVQATRLTEDEYYQYTSDYHVGLEICQLAFSDSEALNLLLGSCLPKFDGMTFRANTQKYSYSGQAVKPESKVWNRGFVERVAKKYLHAPYMWGGKSPFGIDASGYVQMLCKIFYVKLPRLTADQIYVGEDVDFVAQARLGDLAYFVNKEGQINHVGFILDGGEIIHAFGRVRIDKFDHQGIYNKTLKKYTHHLRVIKRVIAIEPPNEE